LSGHFNAPSDSRQRRSGAHLKNDEMTMLISKAASRVRRRIAMDRYNYATGCHAAESFDGNALGASERLAQSFVSNPHHLKNLWRLPKA